MTQEGKGSRDGPAEGREAGLEDRLDEQEKLALLGTLVAGIAHEVKNPLSLVVNFAEAGKELTESLGELVRPQLEELDAGSGELAEILGDLDQNAAAIHRNAQRALETIGSMLELSRPGGADPQPSDLNALVEQYASLAFSGRRVRGPAVSTQIEFDLDPQLPEAPIVANSIGRVLVNLVSNACDAVAERAEDGGGSDFTPTVSVSTAASGPAVEIRVRDNGVGVAAESLQRVFEPFFTTKASGDGIGLGLAVSRDIVEQHEGKIEVRSKPGEFTEFVVTLPVHPAGEPQAGSR